MNDYETKKQERINRYEELAERAENNSRARRQQFKDMMSFIPFGQPILVGHHSEKRDRAYRARAGSKMDKSITEHNRAQHYRDKADAARKNKTISSDDPEAVQKLKTKTDQAEKLQEIMKAANRIVRSKPKNERTPEKITQLVNLGIKETRAGQLFEKDFTGRPGFPDYVLTNNNANIRRMKQRLAELETSAAQKTVETEHNGFSVIENTEENRIQIIFDGKEAYMTLCKNKGINLRSCGFRYSKHNNAWQRHLNNAGRAAVEQVINRIQSN